jgi:HD-GYP domain-containing protein (c-di-GMP phosphodiesterase class II)
VKERLQQLHDFLRCTTTAAANAALYGREHRQVNHLCQQAMAHLHRAQQERELTLMLLDDQLIFDSLPLENNLCVTQLIQAFKRRRIGTIRLLPGINRQELGHLVEVLTRGGQSAAQAVSSEHLRFGQLEVRYASRPDADAARNEGLDQYAALAEIEAHELDEFLDLYHRAQRQKQLNIVGISHIVSRFVDAFSGAADSLLALAPLRGLDEYTYTHSTNVCILNLAQARLLGIEGQALHEIGVAAMLHDIGKLFVPAEILQKPGQLDDREWAIMQEHPRKGAEYLFETPGVPRLAVIAAYEHHMRFDGTGYPRVSRPWQQHLVSQMTTISDFFDALRTHRSYRQSLTLDTVTNILLDQAGTNLHPVLTRNFLKAIRQLDSLQ